MASKQTAKVEKIRAGSSRNFNNLVSPRGVNGRQDASLDRSEGVSEKSKFRKRFDRKNLSTGSGFDPRLYVAAGRDVNDVNDIKEVFDSYDQQGIGVLLPHDIALLLTQHGFKPSRQTIYQTIAQFDMEEAGGLSFKDFIQAISCKPNQRENKRIIGDEFKKYDSGNKKYLVFEDIKKMNQVLKENLDDQTIRKIVQKAATTEEGKIFFEDFYNIMVKDFIEIQE